MDVIGDIQKLNQTQKNRTKLTLAVIKNGQTKGFCSISVFAFGVTERFLSRMGDAERERKRRVEKRDRHGGGEKRTSRRFRA